MILVATFDLVIVIFLGCLLRSLLKPDAAYLRDLLERYGSRGTVVPARRPRPLSRGSDASHDNHCGAHHASPTRRRS